MSVEELLKPRFEIIANYPSNHLGKVGDIIEEDFIFFKKKHLNPITFSKMEEYPHLFRKLNWWEKRTIDQMPVYLKQTLKEFGTTYHKIAKWDMHMLFGFEDVNERTGCSITTWTPEYTYQPCTEEEYLKNNKD